MNLKRIIRNLKTTKLQTTECVNIGDPPIYSNVYIGVDYHYRWIRPSAIIHPTLNKTCYLPPPRPLPSFASMLYTLSSISRCDFTRDNWLTIGAQPHHHA